MKKLVVGLVAAIVVAVGVAGGTVLAQSADEDGTKKSFADRVAEILGLDGETVENAMEQAKSDMKDEREDAWTTKMVEAGKITQEQADAYSSWLDARPDDVGGWFHFGYNPGARDALAAKLAEAVTAGKMTQAQADAYLERYDDKVDGMDDYFAALVAKMVEAEKITQDEADSLTAWYGQRPDGVMPGFGGRGKFGHGRSFGHGKFRGKGGSHGGSGGGWYMHKDGKKGTDAPAAAEGSSA